MNVVVITGAASGIGLALSQVHLHEGHTVVMVDKDTVKLKAEVAQLHILFPQQILETYCDISLPHEVAQLAHYVMEQLGHVNYIYNNAGIIGPFGPIWDLSPERIQNVIDVNLMGMIHIIQAFTPCLFQQTFRSHIINIASLYALCTGSQTAAYSISKHGVLALSESLYFDLKRLHKPVDVSVAFPSFTDTALLSHEPKTNSSFQQTLNSFLSHSRPALDTATHIVQEVNQKKFYIFPDKEVKGYSEERIKAMLLQETPHVTSIEKLMDRLTQRQQS